MNAKIRRSVVFRVDASVRIGTGHVMRCLTLADALSTVGVECLFLMREHEGCLADLVSGRGREVLALAPGDGVIVEDVGHAHWLGTRWEIDAEQSLAALIGRPIDLLIVDHYGLDARWELAMAKVAPRRMALDDLADRPHDVDLLLDQNLGRRSEDYDGLLPDSATRLIGPRYALLRPEFGLQHKLARASRSGRLPRRILVAVGGTDADNITETILERLDLAPLPVGMEIVVVLGKNAPHVASVRRRVGGMNVETTLLVGLEDMARVFSDADIAIGAAGGMSWERCSLGLPTLILILADNQIQAARALADEGAGILVGDVREEGWTTRLITALNMVYLDGRLADMSERAAQVCDGWGTTRVLPLVKQLLEVDGVRSRQ